MVMSEGSRWWWSVVGVGGVSAATRPSHDRLTFRDSHPSQVSEVAESENDVELWRCFSSPFDDIVTERLRIHLSWEATYITTDSCVHASV